MMYFPQVLIYFGNVKVFPEPFVFYLATFVVVWLVRRAFLRARLTLSPREFLALAGFSIVSMLIGTRLWYYWVFDRPRHFGNWVFNLLDPVGLASLGLYVGFFLGIIAWGQLYLRPRRSDAEQLTQLVLDHVAYYLPIGTVIGRIGCFLEAHKFAKPTTLPWGLVRGDAPPLDVPRHPLDLYQVLAALGLFLVLRTIRRRQGSVENLEFWYVTLFATSHFLLDFVSLEALHRPVLGLTADQVACAVVLVSRLLLRYSRLAKRVPRLATPGS
jgi:phosphatidylglycerol---prolipoprotein diacylglyceryl transferase